MISVGMKLYNNDGKEFIVEDISDNIILGTTTKEIIVTHNNGSERYIQEYNKNETYSINDLGIKLFFDYKDTTFGRYEEERRIQIELQDKLEKQNLEKLDRLLDVNYLDSKKFWENNLKDSIDEEEFNEILVNFILEWFKKQNLKSPDYEQAQCIANAFDDILVTARAGSGKTSTIINRAAFLVKHCHVSPSEILILAFNKEAAKEVNKRLEDLIGEYRPHAMTFHALAYAIVHPEEELIFDDVETVLSKSKTIQQVIDSYINDPNWHSRIRAFMLKYFRSEWNVIEKGGYLLSPEDMVKYRKSIPYVGIEGRYYKSKTEKQIADFLFEYNIPFLYEYNYWWDGINYKPDFTIRSNNPKYKGIIIEYFGIKGDELYDEQTSQKRNYWQGKSDYIYIELFPDDKITSEYLYNTISINIERCGLELRKLSNYEIWLLIKDRAIDNFSLLISQFIGRCRKGLIKPDDLKSVINEQGNSLNDLDLEFTSIAIDIYTGYLNMLEMNNEEDFDGLLMRADEIVKKGQTEWHRKSGFGDLRNIKYLFIDEYQDFSILFYKLIDSIREKNKGLKLFCVGDDWQAINGFAGSDLKFFKGFNDYFKDAKQFTITSNYRSYKKIIDVSNQLMKDEGVSSKNVYSELGEVHIAYLNDFIPNDFEMEYYKGDVITPALIRIINTYIAKGQKVALLTRRRNGILFFNNYAFKGFHSEFLFKIRQAFPKEQRHMIVDMNTSHSYKGNEEETIIVVDALYNSYPLIHPSNRFFYIIGSTIDSVISEEKRLFYVALSRAKKSLVIITEQGIESPFIQDLEIENIDINSLAIPKRESSHYIVKVFNSMSNSNNNGTFTIRSDLRANNYKWDPKMMSWYKHYETKNFLIEKLLNETWIKKGNKIYIIIKDEFDNNIYRIYIENGMAHQLN